jgi:uncharacterized membrane protein YqjE
MDADGPQAAGNEGSVHEASAALVGLIGTRLELLGVELREEALHLQHLLVLGVVAAFVLGAALVLAGILVAAAFWDTYRLPALAAVTTIYAIIGLAVVLRVRSSAARRPGPFHATVQELETDLRALREASKGPGP